MNIKKKLLLTFSAIALTTSLFSQHQNVIKQEVKKYNQAFINKDYDTYISHMIPAVVKVAGGVESMKGIVIDQAKIYENNNMSVVSVETDSVGNTIKGEETYHAILSQNVILQLGNDKFKKRAYYLAESKDLGKTWSFIDLEPYDETSLKTFMPYLPEEIKLPQSESALKIEK